MPPDVNSSSSAESHGVSSPGKENGVEDQSFVSLPAHVNVVKDGLLDFNRFVGLEAAMLVLGDEKSGDDNGECIPVFAYKTDGLKASQRAREREFLDNALVLARGSQRLESEFAQDSEWRTLFRDVAITRKDDAHNSRFDQPCMIACAENEPWDTDLDPSRLSHTNPNPDLCFGFPVKATELHSLGGFGDDPSLQNFAVDTLFQLARNGLRCTPVFSSLSGIAKMKTKSKELQVPLLCFPWCIFQLQGLKRAAEVKENEDLALETSRQASLAATAALTMLESLSRFAEVKKDGRHIPPVITITSIGANTTLWLVYSDIIDDQYRDHSMVSIWNGCISKIWDAIQFCRILDNLFLWSQHILRPQVSHCIDQWRLRYNPEVPNLLSRLELDPETVELVHKIQDRLSSIGISPNTHLPELIQQAVILQEVMRLNLPKSATASEQGQDLNIRDELETRAEGLSLSGDNASVAAAFVGGMTDKRKERGAELREEEHEKEEADLYRDSGEDDIYYSAGSQDEATPQPKPPDKIVTVPAHLAASSKESASGYATVTAKIIAAPSKRSLTEDDDSEYEWPVESSANEQRDKASTFSYSDKLKTSGFKIDEEKLPSHSLKSTDAGSGEHTVSRDLVLRSNSNNGSRIADTSSAPPNPFVARSFHLSFPISYSWPTLPIEAPLPPARRVLGPQSVFRKQTTPRKREHTDECNVRFKPPERRTSGSQIADTPNPLLERVKIPWKDGRFIVLRLPPVVPVLPPNNRPNSFLSA